MTVFKVIVAGSRDINNYNIIRNRLDECLKNVEGDIEIVSGGARGVDLLGERYAKERGYAVKQFLADWDKNGKSAGYIRNWEMSKYANACVCFWDEKSRGTKHMIDLARKEDLDLIIFIS